MGLGALCHVMWSILWACVISSGLWCGWTRNCSAVVILLTERCDTMSNITTLVGGTIDRNQEGNMHQSRWSISLFLLQLVANTVGRVFQQLSRLQAADCFILSVVEKHLRQSSNSRLLVFPLQPPEQHSMNCFSLTPSICFKLFQLCPIELESIAHIFPPRSNVLGQSQQLISLFWDWFHQ